jgi:TPR repeat protein
LFFNCFCFKIFIKKYGFMASLPLIYSCDEDLKNRLLPGFWDELKASNAQREGTDAKVALVLCARFDPNGALLGPHHQYNIEQLRKHGLIVHVKVINKAQDVNDSIRDAGSSLETLYFIGHGIDSYYGNDEGAIILDEDEYFTVLSIMPEIWKRSLKSIMFESCSIGKLARAISIKTGITTGGAYTTMYAGLSFIQYCPRDKRYELVIFDCPSNKRQMGQIFEGESSREPCPLLPDQYSNQAAFFEERIRKGAKDPYLYSLLANLYEQGEGIQRDLKRAGEYYRLSAEKNDCHGQTEYGSYWLRGVRGEKSIAEAKKWLQKAADAGDSHGEYRLAMLYLEEAKKLQGEEKKGKEALAAQYLYSSAKKGNALAKIQLAIFRLQMVGTLQKERDAIISRPQQNSADLSKVSDVQTIDQAINQQRGMAFDLLEQVLNSNHREALHDMGKLYLTGSEPEWVQSDVKALECFEKAANLGWQDSFYFMGLFHKEGRGGLKPSIDEAIQWFEKDMKGHAGAYESAYELAILYLWKQKNGELETLSIESEQVLGWLRKAAVKAHLPANYLLGLLYSKGSVAYGISPSADMAQSFFDFVQKDQREPFEDRKNKIKNDLAWALSSWWQAKKIETVASPLPVQSDTMPEEQFNRLGNDDSFFDVDNPFR